MNILITGKNSFLAKELTEYYREREDINLLLTDRTSLDPRSFLNVQQFFNDNKIDIVIHSAVRGGKRGHKDDIEDIFDNVSMFQNLTHFADKFKLMFNFGSGAEFDRETPINNVLEAGIHTSTPSDYYGLTKNLISRKITKMHSNIYNLRLFGCFGEHEEPQRLFRSCYRNFNLGKNAEITQDKYMDYFYAQDVGRVIDHIIQNNQHNTPRDINLCYNKKYTLSQYAEKIKELTKSNCCVIIHDKELGSAYTGNSKVLDSLNIDLIGLQGGMSKCLKNWNKS